jgi:hypothetical protein
LRPIFSLWNYNPENDDGRGDSWNGENFSWFSNSRVAPSRASGKALVLTQDTKELDLGGRILDAVVRPYAAKTAGIPLNFEYEMATGVFAYTWAVPLSPGPGSSEEGQGQGNNSNTTTDALAVAGGGPSVRTPPLTGHPPLLARETEIFVPAQLAQGRKLIVEGLRDGDTFTYDAAHQTLFVLPAAQTLASGEPSPAGMGTGNVQAPHVHKVSVRFDPPVGGELPNDFWSDFGVHVTAGLVVVLALAAYLVLGRI